jgi:glycosyltransferase involved in cell wall biosynthesis
VDVVFRSSGYTKGHRTNHVLERGIERGLRPVTDLSLSKHRAFWRDVPDVARLCRIVAREGFDLVHCHLPNDTRIAAHALRGGSVPFVRTLYDTELHRTPRADLKLLREARSVFVFSRRMQRDLQELGLREDRVVHVESAVDLERFRPDAGCSDRRAELGLAPEDFVAGIVARVQPQRRFDLLLDAAEEVARACPRFRLLIIGRGSKLERTAREPARRRGLLDRIVFFPGYFVGEEFPAVLRALDVKIFLVPGTDGSARAVREALACGLPVVASRRGILPELVRDRVTGRTVDESVAALSGALLELWRDETGRREMGKAARRDACDRFDLRRQVDAVRETYRAVLEMAS